jgi:hypothetical protein
MSALLTVVITWMDGKQEVYRCYDARVGDGVLYLSQHMNSGEPARSFPIANIRTWTTDSN